MDGKHVKLHGEGALKNGTLHMPGALDRLSDVQVVYHHNTGTSRKEE